MKYNQSNKPLQCILTNSTCYKGTKTMAVKGVLIHSTGANNPNLKRYVQPSSTDSNYSKLMKLLGTNTAGNDWNHIERQAGVNAFIGKLADGTITTVQTLPWNYRPWGCGSGSKGSCNNGWIQFEIAEDSLSDAAYFNEIYKEACELIAYLCELYNIDPLGHVTMNGTKIPTILCHKDSNNLGFGSDHTDVLHWFPKFGKTLDDVRNDVSALLNKQEEEEIVTQDMFDEMMNNYLARLAKQPATWEQTFMLQAQQDGLMSGDDSGNLMPKKFVTRGELATVVERLKEKLQ